MFRALLATLIATVLIGVILMGCGGSSESKSLDRAEFTKQADAICRKAEEKKSAALEAAIARGGQSPKPLGRAGEENLVLTVALPPIDEMTKELAALGVPTRDGGQVVAIVKDFEKAIKAVRDKPSSVLTGDPFAEANDAAREYGFKYCSEI
jgi:hypothetical protein